MLSPSSYIISHCKLFSLTFSHSQNVSHSQNYLSVSTLSLIFHNISCGVSYLPMSLDPQNPSLRSLSSSHYLFNLSHVLSVSHYSYLSLPTSISLSSSFFLGFLHRLSLSLFHLAVSHLPLWAITVAFRRSKTKRCWTKALVFMVPGF